MKKRIISMLLAMTMVATLLPATALAVTINDDEVFLKQDGESGTCTLVAATMMLRRRAIIDGNADWESITTANVRSTAWVNGTGLRFSWSYAGMDVSVKSYSGMSNSEKKSALISLLNEHPEGIEIYDGNIPHAVLLTDYDSSTDTFYCADPADGVESGRIDLALSWNAYKRGSASNAINNVTQIWYISNKSGGGPGLTSVTLDANGGSCSQTSAYLSADSVIVSLPTPTRSHYRFLGWYTATSGGEQVSAGYTVSADTTLYAHWEYVPVVTLNANGGSCSQTEASLDSGNKIESLPTPTRTGWRFLGWYTAANGGEQVSAGYAVSTDITLYAHWEDKTIYGETGSLSWSLNPDVGTLYISGSGEIPDYAEDEAPWSGNARYITKISVSSGVKSVGAYAFANLTKLVSVENNAELKKLGEGAFKNCAALSDISGIEGIKVIGSYCFYGCTSLSEIGIPSGCTAVESCAFAKTPIKTLSVPTSVTSLGSGAFSDCTQLSRAELPAALTKIPASCFSGCTALTSFFMYDDSSYGASVCTVETGAFKGCTALSEVNIYNRADSLVIARNAFSGCTALKSVNLDCRSITIESSAFASGSSLNYIYISGELGSVSDSAFSGVSANVVYPENLSSWSGAVGKSYGGTLTWEGYNAHVHSYKMEIVAPTCSERGYTVYTCTDESCGDTFRSDYVSPLGHNFVNGVCSVCGKVNPFSDLDAKGKDKYFTDAILWAYNEKITTGTGTDASGAIYFSPDESCTRAQVVTFLWRAAGRPAPSATDTVFSDVKQGSYYETAVAWAYENGITLGVDGSRFAPDDMVTREQFVTFLWRYLDKPAAGGEKPFADISQGTFSYNAIIWAYSAGVTLGTGNGCFSPKLNASRGQVVTFIYRALA